MVDATLQGRRILVVEDDYLVAMSLCDLLEDAGAQVIGPISRLDEALDFVAANPSAFDAALLDINLRGVKSYPIADALAARDVRVVFSTGYGSDALDEAYRRFPRCEKPFNQQALVAALAP